MSALASIPLPSAGDILTLLKSIVYLEPEAVITPSGVCPYVWVEGLSITGEA
jgi:PmbA protein